MLTDSGIERVEQRLGVGNLYDPQNIAWLHHVTQALRAHTLYKRDVNYLVDEGKIDHRRRVHRPEDAGPALVGRPAPGDRGQGRRRDPGGEPDPGHHQLPELLPPLQEAGGHDRHRRHRGRGVPQDLQAGRHGHPDQPADGAQGPPRHRLQEREGQVPAPSSTRLSTATSAASRCWSARSASRSPRSSPRCCARRASRTTC